MEKSTLVKWVHCLTRCPPLKTVKDLSCSGHLTELCNFINTTTYTAPDKSFENCLEERYAFIKETFEYYFNIDGMQLFNYALCKAGSDSNIAKLAIMLLYAFMIQAIPSRSDASINDYIAKLYELEIDAQQSIKACIRALINTKDETTALVETLASLTSLMDIELVELSTSAKKKAKRKRTSSIRWSPLRTYIESADLQQQVCEKKIKLHEKKSKLKEQKLEEFKKENEKLRAQTQNDKKNIEDLEAECQKLKSSQTNAQSIENEEHSQMEIEGDSIPLGKRVIMSDSCTQVENVRDDIIDKDEKLKSPINEVAELMKENAELKLAFDEMKSENVTLNNKVTNSKFQESMYKKKWESLSSELEQIKDRQSSFSQFAEERKAMDMMNKKIIEDSKTEIKKSKEEKAKEIAALKKEHAKHTCDNLDNLKMIEQEKKSLENQLNQITDHYGTSVNQVNIVEEINEHLKSKLDDLSKKYNESIQKTEMQEAEIENLRQELRAQHWDFSENGKYVEGSYNEICEMETNEQHLQVQEEREVRVQREMLESKQTQTEETTENDESKEFKLKKEELEKEIEELKLKDLLMKDIESLQLQLTEQNEKVNDYESQLAVSQKHVEELKMENEVTSSNLHQERVQKMQLESNITELTSRLENSEVVCKDLEKENQRLIDAGSFSSEKVANDLKCKEEELLELKQAMAQLQENLTLKISDIKIAEEKYAELKNELEYTGGKYTEMKKEKNNNEQEVAYLKEEIRRYKNEIKETEYDLKKAHAKLDSLKRRLEEQQEVVHRLKQELANSKKVKNALIAEKFRQHETIEKQKVALEEKTTSYEDKFMRLEHIHKEELHHLYQEKREMLDDFEKRKNNYEDEIEQRDFKIEKLRNELSEKWKVYEEKSAKLVNDREEERKLWLMEKNEIEKKNDELQGLQNVLMENCKVLEEQIAMLENKKLEEQKLLKADNNELLNAKLNLEKEQFEVQNQFVARCKTLEDEIAKQKADQERKDSLRQVRNDHLRESNLELEKERNELIESQGQFAEKCRVLEEQVTRMTADHAEIKQLWHTEKDELRNSNIELKKNNEELIGLQNQFIEKFKSLEEEMMKRRNDYTENHKVWQVEKDKLQKSVNFEIEKKNTMVKELVQDFAENREALENEFSKVKSDHEEKEKLWQAENLKVQNLANFELQRKNNELKEFQKQMEEKNKWFEEECKKPKNSERFEHLKRRNITLSKQILPKVKKIALRRKCKIKVLEKKLSKLDGVWKKKMEGWKRCLYNKFSEKTSGKFHQLVTEIQRLTELTCQLQSELDTKCSKEKNFEEQITNIKENAESRIECLTSRKNEQITELEKQNRHLLTDVKCLKITIEIDLAKQISKLKKHVRVYKSKMMKLQKIKGNLSADVPEETLKRENEHLKLRLEEAIKEIDALQKETQSLKTSRSLAASQLHYYEQNNNVDALYKLQCESLKHEKETAEDSKKIEEYRKACETLTDKCKDMRKQLEIVQMKKSITAFGSLSRAYSIQEDIRELAAREDCPPSVINHPLLKPNDDFSFISLGSPIPENNLEDDKKGCSSSPQSTEPVQSDDKKRKWWDSLTEEEKKIEKERILKVPTPYLEMGISKIYEIPVTYEQRLAEIKYKKAVKELREYHKKIDESYKNPPKVHLSYRELLKEFQ